MFRFGRAALVVGILPCLWSIQPRLLAQTSSAITSADYSKEGFVIEQLISRISAQNDGTFTIDTSYKVRIQSDSGVQQWGLLRYPYPSSSGDVEIVLPKVVKPDGSTVETPRENVQDVPAQITVSAPVYSDLKEKHIAVKGLAIGDLLEYEIRFRMRDPLMPGEFWFSSNFFTGGIVLQEQLQISVPANREVKVKSPKVSPSIAESNGYRAYTWNTSNLMRKSPEEQADELETSPRFADVQLTSLRTWDQVAQWYYKLEEPRLAPTPEIRAKAEELTRGAATEDDKVRALYNYVAKNVRYIAISIGIGRYQPHFAGEILSNGYGDCKDQHTLLASLLTAAGIKAYPALVNSAQKIDPDMPQPQQFDHLITAVPRGKDWLWLDTTTEVAPAGFLVASIRDKQVLIVSASGTAQLATTPADPPFKSLFEFHMAGTISSDGTLEGKADAKLRGDAELLWRLAFRRTPQAQWSDLMQKLSEILSFAGSVSDVSVSTPEATDDAFHVSYNYNRKNYANWPTQILAAVPPANLATLSVDADKRSAPIKLEAPGEYLLDSDLAVGTGVAPEQRPAVDVKKDFAEYHAEYSWNSSVLHIERRLTIKMREIPHSRIEEYRSFVKSVNDDQQSFIALHIVTPDRPAESAANKPEAAAPAPLDPLIDQKNTEIEKLADQSEAAFRRGDFPAAMDSLEKAIAIDPRRAPEWILLGELHVRTGSVQQGFDEMKKALTLDPGYQHGYETLAMTYAQLRRLDEALNTWNQLKKIAPDDLLAAANIGAILIEQGHFADAVSELDPIFAKHPQNATLAYGLGRAYFGSGDSEKGAAMLQKAVELNSSPAMLMRVAYELTSRNQALDQALGYARKAVETMEDDSSHIYLQALTIDNLRQMAELAQAWDALGWVQFRLGHLDEAEKYLAAAWNLSQWPQIGDHLGQLYQQTRKKKEASHYYALSLAAGKTPSDTAGRLSELLGKEQADQAVNRARSELADLRTVTLPRLVKSPARAEFFVVFEPGAGATQLKFITGSEELRHAADAVISANYHVVFPDDHPAKIVRRGILDCSAASLDCKFVLFTPESVNAIN